MRRGMRKKKNGIVVTREEKWRKILVHNRKGSKSMNQDVYFLFDKIISNRIYFLTGVVDSTGGFSIFN